MLVLARKLPAIVNSLRGGTWDAARALGAGSHEIAGKTLGICGVGAIGTRLAKIAHHGFGMRVLGNQRRLDRLPPEAQPTDLDELVAQSDFVVVTCPLTKDTHHLFDHARFARMKASAWL